MDSCSIVGWKIVPDLMDQHTRVQGSGVARGGQMGASAPGRQGLGRQNED